MSNTILVWLLIIAWFGPSLIIYGSGALRDPKRFWMFAVALAVGVLNHLLILQIVEAV